MKKLICIILCLSILLLCGCTSPVTDPTTEPSTVPTEATTASTTEATQEVEPFHGPLIAFSGPVITDTYKADNGADIFSYSVQDMSLILEDPQIAEDIFLQQLNLTDFENSSAASVLDAARQAYEGQSDWTPYAYSILYNPMRLDSSILSMYGTEAIFNGNLRSTSIAVSVTYDLLTGRQLTLKDILVEDFSADELSNLIVAALEDPANEGILYSDYAYVISEMFYTNTPITTWYFSGEGLCFYFAPYEIAPHSAGTVTAQIPYASLLGMLKDSYFPDETTQLSGQLSVKLFADMDLSAYEQFAELILDKDGTEYILSTAGAVSNVTVEYGHWQHDGSFLPESTVFCAATLCDTTALMVQVSDMHLQNLRITYRSNGEICSARLSSLLS